MPRNLNFHTARLVTVDIAEEAFVSSHDSDVIFLPARRILLLDLKKATEGRRGGGEDYSAEEEDFFVGLRARAELVLAVEEGGESAENVRHGRREQREVGFPYRFLHCSLFSMGDL